VSRVVKRLIIGVVALAVVVVGGTMLYVYVIEGDPPARLEISSTSTSNSTSTTAAASGSASGSGSASASVEGTWKAIGDSVVGYRVDEVLFGQNVTAVGRTSDVSGTLTVAGNSVTKVDLSVDMTTVKSDQSNRDNQFRGRIMSTSQYPTATFALTQPITIPSDLGSTAVTVKGTGNLTLHGTTKSVTVDLKVVRSGNRVTVNGTIPITFADYSIPNPTFGPASTEDHGELELLVVFEKSS
jgi:polyisoprenoid-binding protein YceI